MDTFQGITTEIISNGQVLKLYDDPDAAESEESRSRQYYVEAVAGSTFQVKVNLTSRFNLYKRDAEHAIYMGVKIDGSFNTSYYYTMENLQGKFSRGQLGGHTFAGVRQFCKETGQWILSDYSFGNLVLKENSDPNFSVKQAQELGRIQVTVKPVRLETRKDVYIPNKTPIATIHEAPEKALKGRPIETIVRLTNARPTAEPSYKTTQCRDIGGEAGQPVVFNILYRSRRALQMIGIIPRSPSPEVQSPSDLTTAPEDATKEVRDLRARLALLEGGLNVKSEPSSAAASFKRERDEESNEGSRQRVKVEHVDLTDDRPGRRTSVKVEHIDLTGD